ncbi:MAG: hypothetical protein ABW185_23595 [Sedimenticola sp.]
MIVVGNSLLTIFSRDIPVGKLHVLNLGLTKHLLKCVVTRTTLEQRKKMEAHLIELKVFHTASKL